MAAQMESEHISISFDKVERIKRELRTLLPDVKSSHRAEGMARGLGFNTNAALRAELGKGLTHCSVHPARFSDYLSQHGFEAAPLKLITAIIAASEA